MHTPKIDRYFSQTARYFSGVVTGGVEQNSAYAASYDVLLVEQLSGP